MVPQLVNGNVTTTAAADATSSATTVTPAATTGFPTIPTFTVLVRETGELLLVTAINAGPTWTVTRAYGGTTAAAITGTGGSPYHLDYSVTREMLLLGFVTKLDEDVVATDRATGVMTLTPPTWLAGLGLRGLRVVINAVAGTATAQGVHHLQMRVNGSTATTEYFTEFAYWGSGSTSIVAPNGLAFARLPWISAINSVATPTNYGAVTFDILGALDTDRWKSWSGTFHGIDGNANRYSGVMGGDWRNVAAITSLTFSADVLQNGAWAGNTIKAGSRAVLLGLP